MFDSLFRAKTAHELIREARQLVVSYSIQEQSGLLKDEMFIAVVGGGLSGLDQCRQEHYQDLVLAFNEANQLEAQGIFSRFLL